MGGRLRLQVSPLPCAASLHCRESRRSGGDGVSAVQTWVKGGGAHPAKQTPRECAEPPSRETLLRTLIWSKAPGPAERGPALGGQLGPPH